MTIIKKSMIFVLLLVGYLSIGSVLGQSTTTVDVDVISYFDGTEITNTVSNVVYGSSLSFEGSLTSQNDYEFGYFVVNDVVEEYLSSTYDFIIKNEMNIRAIFTPTDKHVVLFRDSNGTLLDIEYVTDGASVSDAEVPLPDKPGMVVSTSKWDTSLDNIVSNSVITLQYDLDTSLSFDLIVTDGAGDGTYAFNSEVTISAPLTSGSDLFSHFEENGQVISRENEVIITMLGDRSITAIYTDSDVSDAPFVSLSNDLELRGGYSSFIGYYYIPDGMSLVEYGMISSTNEIFDLDSVGVVLHQGEIVNPDTDEYLFSFNSENYVYIRGYVVFKDSSDNIIEIYSDTKACTGEITEEVLFYETDIEDGSKGSYAIGTATLNGKDWTFDNSLIAVGGVNSDQYLDSKSIRMKTGNIESEFTVTTLGKISFYHGRYLGDSASTIDLDISLDGTNWVTVDSNILSDTAFTLYEFVFTDTVYSGLSLNGIELDSTDPYYIRIHNDNDQRVNIDDIKIYTGGSSPVTNPTNEESTQTDILEMSVSGLETTDFMVGDTFPGVCTATDMIEGDVPCTVSGYNMDVAGTYDVLFTAIDFEGHSHLITVSINVTESGTVSGDLAAYLSVDYVGYYDGIEGSYGEDLKNVLNDIITNHTEYYYTASSTDVWDIMRDADEDPDNSDNVMLFYTGLSMPKACQDGSSDEILCTYDINGTNRLWEWNREHIWSKSRGDFATEGTSTLARGAHTDLHHLVPAEQSMNSTKNNRFFEDCHDGDDSNIVDRGYGNYTCNEWEFEPRDDIKGDVARMIFYMATRYEGEIGDYVDLEVVDDPDEDNSLKLPVYGDLDDLLRWNLEDPVDQTEMDRNEVIYGYQNNRNPFIDYPYLIELIWNYNSTY